MPGKLAGGWIGCHAWSVRKRTPVKLIQINACERIGGSLFNNILFAMYTHPDSECFLAYAPRGGGLLCAVVLRVRGDDVYGWWVGRDADAEYPPAFFMLENYYSTHELGLLTTSGGDLMGGWTHNYGAVPHVLAPAQPVEDTIARALNPLQFAFAREWLVYPEDANAAQQASRYADAELGMGAVAVRFECLGRFEKSQPVWRYFSRGLDYRVIERLMRCWPLAYKTDRQAN